MAVCNCARVYVWYAWYVPVSVGVCVDVLGLQAREKWYGIEVVYLPEWYRVDSQSGAVTARAHKAV